MAVGLLLLPGFRLHATTDGVSYISIAEHYANGQLSAAVNAYWSPLLSWLLAPVVALGVPGTLAFKLVNLGVAVGSLGLTRRLARGLGAGEGSVEVVSWALVLPLVAAAYAVMSPDLLVVLPVLLYLDALVRVGDTPWLRSGLTIGAAAGLAYLAKLFALPFVAVHLPLALLVLARRHGVGVVARAGAVALAVGGLIVGVWAGALTAKYDEPTLGTAATTNLGFMGEGAAGAEPLWAGLLPPPHEEATSSWEDLPRSLELVPDAGDTAAPDAGDTAAPEPPDSREGVGADPLGLLTRGLTQLDRLAGELVGWAAVLLLAAATPLTLRASRSAPPGASSRIRARHRPHPAATDPWPLVLVAGAAAIWAGGVLLTYVETRYLWGALLPLAAIATVALDAWRTARPRDTGREIAALLLVVGLLPWAGNELHREWRATDPVWDLARAIEGEVDLSDANVASMTRWLRGVGICHIAGCSFYGTPRTPTTGPELTAELDRYDVEYLLADEAPPEHLGLGEPAAVIDERLLVYEVR